MKETNLVSLPIGDWSDDGHGKFIDYAFEVPSEFTKEVLVENYKRNKEKFGFGLTDFAQDYLDSTIPRDNLKKIMEAGLDTSKFESNFDPNTDVYLSTDDMFQIAVFFIGHGLEGFTYQMAPKPDFTLIDSRNSIESSIGYGLFY